MATSSLFVDLMWTHFTTVTFQSPKAFKSICIRPTTFQNDFVIVKVRSIAATNSHKFILSLREKDNYHCGLGDVG